MAERFATINETDGYQTVTDPTNTPATMLIAGSQNVLIDQQKKVKSRAGYRRFGVGNAALTPVKYQAPTWNTSSDTEFPMRPYNTVLEAYLGTVDGVAINAYTQIFSGIPAAAQLRFAPWYDNTENEDVLLWVQGDQNIYEWSGGVAIVDSVSSNSGIVGAIVQPNSNTGGFNSSGGINYTVGDILTITGGGGTGATVMVDAVLPGPVATVSSGYGGTGYVVNDLLRIVGGSGNALVRVATLAGSAVASVTLVASGSNYVGNTIYNVSGGTGTGAQVEVLTIAGGGISQWHVITNGSGYSSAGELATTGGTGTGATVGITSVATGSVTKKGTKSFSQNRFYGTRNMSFICVRTGVAYSYTIGVSTLTLAGIGDTSGLIAGDILIQNPVIRVNLPAPPAGGITRTNDTIFVFDNQAFIASDNDNVVHISKGSSYYDFSYSAPRAKGEGGLMTLNNPVTGFGTVGNNIIVFCRRSDMFTVSFQEITIDQGSSTPALVSEQLSVKKINAGIDQSAQSQEVIIPIGNQLMYLSFEPALRIIKNPSDVAGIDPETYSNPIKPDFDGIDWTGASLLLFKNAAYLSARSTSRLYILEFIQNADGKTTRFWQAPQILPVGALSIIQDGLYGNSNAVPETYQLFTGGSDGDYDGIATADRLPFKAIALFAYGAEYFIPRKLRMFSNRSSLKSFDQYYSEGEILAGTKINLSLLYDFGGSTQVIQKVIDGEDPGIVQEDVNLSSLGQSSFGTQPLGGSAVEPADKLRYRVVFDLPKEDYYQLAEQYETEQVDAYFGIVSRGPNAQLSSHIDTIISR